MPGERRKQMIVTVGEHTNDATVITISSQSTTIMAHVVLLTIKQNST